MMKYKALLFLNIVKLWRKNTLKVVELTIIVERICEHKDEKRNENEKDLEEKLSFSRAKSEKYQRKLLFTHEEKLKD